MSYSHQPPEYQCPFCGMLDASQSVLNPDLVYQDNRIFSIISLHWWENNPGHALIMPKQHFENIYTLPFELSDRIHRLEKVLALAMKEVYRCDGISSRQHNEPAGYQDVWHYHLHVFPRYQGDRLYRSQHTVAPEFERQKFAQRLRSYFAEYPPELGMG